MDLKELLSALCLESGMGGLDGAQNTAADYLSRYATVSRSPSGVTGIIKGNGSRLVLLDAHIDEIGMFVTEVSGGFIRVAAAGGIDRRMLAAMRVKIFGKETVPGVFCSIPPHLRKEKTDAPAMDELYIDTGLGDRASEIVSVGDRVTFQNSLASLDGSYVTAKSLDNRAGVASLIRTAELLCGKELPCSVAYLFSDKEEIGGDGARAGSYSLNPCEAVAVDVSFGNAPDIPADKTGKLGGGAMIGISPVLSDDVTKKLISAAKSVGAKYQTEVMGGRTSTNADVISVSRCGVPTGLLSVPLRNMHTPVEIIDINDVENTAQILAAYILRQPR